MTATMRAVQIRRYGPAEQVLELVEDVPVPVPAADEILIRASATAINPVDCTARNGYGRHFFSSLWGDLPLILGRDVSGTVVAAGSEVRSFSAGDEVYAAPHIGCYAEYVVVKAAHAATKPRNLDHLQAAALPFVALTTWSALVDHAGLSPGNAHGLQAVIPRAAGGVGSFAVQLLKAWGAHVSAICSTRNVELVRALGADVVIDYTRQDFSELLRDQDLVLDTVGKPSDFETMEGPRPNAGSEEDFDDKLLNVLKRGNDAVYVTICSPKMMLTDSLGLQQGLQQAQKIFQQRAAVQQALGRRYCWSFFNPSGAALARISELVESGDIKPVIDSEFALEDMVAAHQRSESGRTQGKIVIRIGGAS
ncbi:MAG: zinc-binding dehydrogenase [Gammaproteobacteria bacterium]|nr:zinc-binding dehydrogenase [Gammaproteobacteria bacterium]